MRKSKTSLVAISVFVSLQYFTALLPETLAQSAFPNKVNRINLMKLPSMMGSVVLVSWLIPALLVSQAVTGGIRGTIQDESGAVIPGVSITATHKTLGITRQAVTDDTGTYLLPDLNAGEWEVKAQLESFQTQVQTFTVATGSTGNVDFKIKVGASSQVVEVSGQAAQVNTT